MKKMRNRKIREINRVALSTAFIIICSWLTIPGVVPYTMQSFAVFTVAALFGGRCGFLSVLVYILLAMVGIPVLSGGRGGIGAVFGETGGYLLGFLIGSLVCGIICRRKKSTAAMFWAMLLCLTLCYAFECIWVAVLYHRLQGTVGVAAVASRFVLPFVIPDVLKTVLAVFTVKAIRKTKII